MSDKLIDLAFQRSEAERDDAIAALTDERDAERARADRAEDASLTVWYGEMPESNGKRNWTASLHRKDGDAHMDGFCFARSEYPDRVRYEADRMRWIIGELAKKPHILDYDADLHSGYQPEVSPMANDRAIAAEARVAELEGANAQLQSDLDLRNAQIEAVHEMAPAKPGLLHARLKELSEKKGPTDAE